MKPLKVPKCFSQTATDDELRVFVKKNCSNGEYALAICKNCGTFTCSPKGDTKTAKIKNKCRDCYSEDENV